jgi:hypothetical protein
MMVIMVFREEIMDPDSPALPTGMYIFLGVMMVMIIFIVASEGYETRHKDDKSRESQTV